MRYRDVDRVVVTIVVLAAVAFLLTASGAQFALADNVIPNPREIAMEVGTPFTLNIKNVANDAQTDPQKGCNANDGTPLHLTLLISPSEGLTASPNPLTINSCGGSGFPVTLSAEEAGTYEITPSFQDDNPLGVYHPEPFGIVIVTVVNPDITPPVITVDPQAPTAEAIGPAGAPVDFNVTAVDDFDGIIAATCDAQSGQVFAIGTTAVSCTATDAAGNTGSLIFNVIVQQIAITSVNPPSTVWGSTVTVNGTVGGALPVNTVEVDLGDGNITSGIPISGGTWSIDHKYSTTGTKVITAYLKDGAVLRATSVPSQVIVEKRDTTLQIISPPEDLFFTSNTKMLVGVNLADASGSGVEGAAIEFTGNVTSDATTQGVTFNGNLTLNSCPASTCFLDGIGIDPDDPDGDGEGLPPNADNKVLDVKVGGEISFPVTTTTAFVYLQGNSEPIEYRVLEYGGIQQDCGPDPGLQDCILGVPDPGEGGLITAPSGVSVVGGVTVFNGIEKIIITKVGTSTVDGTVRITAILTKNDDSVPSDQHVINLENEATGAKSSPYTLNGGLAFAYHVTQDTEGSNLEFQADFPGNQLYEPSSAIGTYNIQNDGDPLTGVGGVGEANVDSGTGTAFSARSCTGSCDSDFDAIPNVEETARLVDDNNIAPGESYQITLEPGDANDVFPSTTKPDVYYEVDCHADVTCLTAAQADYIESRFSLRGIQMHIDIDETDVCGNVPGLVTPVNPVIAWSDGQAENTLDGVETAAECNDFTSIKLNHFGTEAERGDPDGSGVNLGSTLGSGWGEGKLKHLFTRYLLFTYNTNNAGVTNCGTTGVAEFIGNDAIASPQCMIDAATNPVGIPQIRLGTAMHEMGHNLGLKHGGTDDINCKCNYISVMNYVRQMPNEEMIVMAGGQTGTGAGGAYQWYGDYSHGPLLYQSAAGVNVIGDGKTVNEVGLADNNRLVLTGGSLWKEADGVKVSSLATVTKFKTLWSDTTPNAVDPIKDGYAATTFASSSAINWNGITGLTAGQDTNYLTVVVGGDQLPACTQALETTNLLSPVDDYATMKAKLDEAMNQNTDLLGLSQSGFQDPDNLPEINLETYETLSGVIFQSQGVEHPLNTVGFADPGMAQMKKGSTVNVKLNIFDEEGNEVTGSNALSVYGIEQINLKLALVTSEGPPEDQAYFSPATSTQPGFADFFTYSNKWTLSFGTKNLQLNGVYAARIQLLFTSGEIYVLDNKNDTVDNVSFMLKIVKG